jgi:transcriptional regulator with XRE-family HTH domain
VVASSTAGHPAGVRDPDRAAAYLAAFGRAVRRYREKLGLSQEKFAFDVELDRTYVSGIERGVRNPTVKTILRLTRALGVAPSTLLKAAEKSAN